MTDAERTQFIARTPPPALPLRGDQYPPEEEDHHRRTGLIWAAVVVALLLVIGGAAYAIVFLGKDKNTVKKYPVPDVIGESQDAAVAQLRNHFVPQPGGYTNGPCYLNQKVEENQVCIVIPSPGLQVQENQQVVFKPELVIRQSSDMRGKTPQVK